MRRRIVALAVAGLVLPLSGCGEDEPSASDSTEPPEDGLCRLLDATDIRQPVNDTPPVDCTEEHTAETFLVGTFTGKAAEASINDEALGAYVYETCQARFMEHLGATESLAMRSTVTWAWFRPSEEGWADGARWFRCDVIGGGEQSEQFVALPESSEGLLLGKPDDRWMVCASGPSVSGAVKVPCSEPHDWRAISTVVLGQAKDPYPGDREVEVQTRDFCSDQVGAYLNYPVTDYDFGFTWFHEGEWKAGNRRSICWAKSEQ